MKEYVCQSCSTTFKKFPSRAPLWCSRKCMDINRMGDKTPNWQGGKTSEAKLIRNSSAYSVWRRHVFQRDDYTCQACGQRGGRLQADHELPFSIYPALRLEILNGQTLCTSCHAKTPTFALGIRNFIKEFIY